MSKQRMRGEGSVYRRNDGRWTAVLNLGYRDGKRRRKTVYARTQREAVRKLEELKRTATKDMPTASMKLEQWLENWLAEIAPTTGKPSKVASQRTSVRNYIVPAIGRIRLDRLTTGHVRDLHNFVMVTKGLSSTTALHAHAVLSVALNDAMRESPPLVQRNVASIVRAPRKQENDRRGMSMPEAVAVLRGAGEHDPRLGGRWMVAFMLGLRQGERLGMRWQMLDLDKGVADLSWQLQRIPYRHGCGDDACGRRQDRCPQRQLDVRPDFTYHRIEGNRCLVRLKTRGSQRVVPLPPPVVAVLRVRLEDVRRERAGYEADHDLVWCREDGRPLEAGEDWRDWRDLLRHIGMPHLTQHEARHTTATLLQSLGVDEATRMSVMGHSEAATQRGYAHIDLTLQRRALDALGERLSLEQ